MRSLRLAAGLGLLVALVSACTPVKDWLRATPDENAEPTIGGSEGPAPYVQDMYEIASGDPATQAEIYADAAAAAALTPDTMSRLRFALVLATPGHPGSDPDQAQSILRELLAEPELLTPMERSLAVIHLRDVEERLVDRKSVV